MKVTKPAAPFKNHLMILSYFLVSNCFWFILNEGLSACFSPVRWGNVLMASGVRTEPKIGLDGLFFIEELMVQAAESSLGIFCIWDGAHLHSKAYKGKKITRVGLWL